MLLLRKLIEPESFECNPKLRGQDRKFGDVVSVEITIAIASHESNGADDFATTQ